MTDLSTPRPWRVFGVRITGRPLGQRNVRLPPLNPPRYLALILAGGMLAVGSVAWAQAPDLSQLGSGTLPIHPQSTTATLGTDRTFATCPDGWTLVMRLDMTPSCAWVLKDAEWR